MEKYPYFLFHNLLLELYKSDDEVKRHIDNLRYTGNKLHNGAKDPHMWKSK